MSRVHHKKFRVTEVALERIELCVEDCLEKLNKLLYTPLGAIAHLRSQRLQPRKKPKAKEWMPRGVAGVTKMARVLTKENRKRWKRPGNSFRKKSFVDQGFTYHPVQLLDRCTIIRGQEYRALNAQR